MRHKTVINTALSVVVCTDWLLEVETFFCDGILFGLDVMPDELRLTLHLCGFKHQHSVSIKPTSSNIFLVWTRELLATISMKRPFSFSHECCDLKMR